MAPAKCGLLTVPDLIGHVRAWCAGDTDGALVVDLSQVEQIDPAAVRSLVWARRYCASMGRSLVIVPPRAGVLQRQDDLLLCDMVSLPPTQADPAPPLAPA